MYVKLFSAYLSGIEGCLVEVEVDITNGLPHFDIVGLPGSALKESKERVRAAVKNSGYRFPTKRITVNLAPAHVRKEGSSFDLAIAVAILMADCQIQISRLVHLEHLVFIGELALDGNLREVQGLFPLMLAAQEKGFKQIFLPEQHLSDNPLLRNIELEGFPNLKSVTSYMENPTKIENKYTTTKEQSEQKQRKLASQQENDMSPKDIDRLEDISGQAHVKRAFEVAAFGLHHILLVGPPGSGKSMLAKRMVHLLPQLTEQEAIEVTKIHSAAGQAGARKGLVKERPFRHPHHAITSPALLGGGVPVKPGEISLAHHGVLFLDEFLEFDRTVMEGLREPLEEGQVVITRVQNSFLLPCRFLLITAMNPCPCGYLGYETEQRSCSCTATQILRYQQKLSGPVYDRLDMHVEVPPLEALQLLEPHKQSEQDSYTTQKVNERIKEALRLKRSRKGTLKPNAWLDHKEIKKECVLTSGAQELLKNAFERLQFSARGYHKILKIARSIADLNHTELIDELAIAEALRYRSLDRLSALQMG